MPGYLLSESAYQRFRRLSPPVPSDKARPQPERWFSDSQAGDQGQIAGDATSTFGPADDITIDNIELLWGQMPDGVPEGTQGSGGEFTVRNLFSQAINEGQRIVAFETIEEDPITEQTPGLSTGSGDALAASTGDELAAAPGVGTTAGGDIEWWGFTPGGGEGVGYFELTENMPLSDNLAAARPVLLDGSRDDNADPVWLIDDDHEATRFEGLKEYIDADDAATVHAGYRFFASFVTDDWNTTGRAAYRIIDGEGPLDRIVVTIADNDTIGTGAVKVKASGDYEAGDPDNGRFPKYEGEISAGAGGGGYFTAYDTLSLFQGDNDDAAKYVVSWNAGSSQYIFLEKFEGSETHHAIFKTNSTIPAASEVAGELTLGEGTGQQWTLKTGETKIYTLEPASTPIFNSQGQSVANGVDIQCKRLDGQWLVDVEDCP